MVNLVYLNHTWAIQVTILRANDRGHRTCSNSVGKTHLDPYLPGKSSVCQVNMDHLVTGNPRGHPATKTILSARGLAEDKATPGL